MSVPDDIRALVYALHKLADGPLMRGQAGVRINLSPLNVETDGHWKHCFSVDVNADSLARIIKALQAGAQPAQAPVIAATEPTAWSAAAVAHIHSQVYADVEDLFEGIDPASYLDDIVDAESPEAAQAAYEQLVTGEWDGEL